jgi:hypothetical protein
MTLERIHNWAIFAPETDLEAFLRVMGLVFLLPAAVVCLIMLIWFLL